MVWANTSGTRPPGASQACTAPALSEMVADSLGADVDQPPQVLLPHQSEETPVQVGIVVDGEVTLAADDELAGRVGVVPLTAESDPNLLPRRHCPHSPTHASAGRTDELPLSRTMTTSMHACWTPPMVTPGSVTRFAGSSCPVFVCCQS